MYMPRTYLRPLTPLSLVEFTAPYVQLFLSGFSLSTTTDLLPTIHTLSLLFHLFNSALMPSQVANSSIYRTYIDVARDRSLASCLPYLVRVRLDLSKFREALIWIPTGPEGEPK